MGVLRRAKLRRLSQCANQLWRPLGRDRSIRAQAKKRQLEAERALLVQEQVQSACERIKEFQAHFACLPADVFVKLGKLRAHESLHDSLYVYYSRKDVEEAKNHGEIFVFLSHQWLAWSAPDPENVRAGVESTSELGDFVTLHAIEQTQSQGRRRVDGVGRPKFYFHAGPRGRHAPGGARRG